MEPAEQPFTKTPNAFYDRLLAKIGTLSELKVTLAIIRKTSGWGIGREKITLAEFEELTGLSNKMVVRGIAEGMERGTIRREKFGKSFLYTISTDCIGEKTSSSRRGQHRLKSNQGCNEYTDVENTPKANEGNEYLDNAVVSTPSTVDSIHSPELTIKKELNKEEKKYKEEEGDKSPPAQANKKIRVIKLKEELPEDTNQQHEAVLVYREVAKVRKVSAAQAAEIAAKVTDITLWRDTVRRWLGQRYKASSVAGMIEVYEHGGKFFYERGSGNGNRLGGIGSRAQGKGKFEATSEEARVNHDQLRGAW